jgi:hypothetical protein
MKIIPQLANSGHGPTGFRCCRDQPGFDRTIPHILVMPLDVEAAWTRIRRECQRNTDLDSRRANVVQQVLDEFDQDGKAAGLDAADRARRHLLGIIETTLKAVQVKPVRASMIYARELIRSGEWQPVKRTG